jgi:hypothetical protein
VELSISRVVSDNERLRGRVLELEEGGEAMWKDDQIVELKFLLSEAQARNKDPIHQRCGLTPNDEADMEFEELKAKQAVLTNRVRILEGAVQTRDTEIKHLQSLLGEDIIQSTSNPAARLIYLEEHSRKLEQVHSPQCRTNKMLSPQHRQDTTSRPNADDVDIIKTTGYEALTTELMTYKRQRDAAREKAARYKLQSAQTLQELQLQTSKFQLLATEFRRLIQDPHT